MSIPVQLAEIGSLGLYDLDITGQPPQGPFTRMAYSATATYPSLWNHNARNETRMICAPDSQLQVRPGMEAKAATVWTTAGRSHLNREFTFGSQALAVSFTEQESIGGRVWPNVNFPDKRFDYAFAVWGNCTLGLLSYWWHSSRGQGRRGPAIAGNQRRDRRRHHRPQRRHRVAACCPGRAGIGATKV